MANGIFFIFIFFLLQFLEWPLTKKNRHAAILPVQYPTLIIHLLKVLTGGKMAGSLCQVLAPPTEAALWCLVEGPSEFQPQREDVCTLPAKEWKPLCCLCLSPSFCLATKLGTLMSCCVTMLLCSPIRVKKQFRSVRDCLRLSRHAQ